MISVKRIELAEQQVADVQTALSVVQAGLERVDSVVTRAGATKERSQRKTQITVALVLVGVAILFALWSKRRDGRQE